MVHGLPADHQPIDKHVVRRIIDQAVLPHVFPETAQQLVQGGKTLFQQLLVASELVNLPHHVNPYQRIRRMEEPSVTELQDLRRTQNVKSGQPHVAECSRRHHRFDIIIPCAGQWLLMFRTVQMHGLTAYLQCPFAYIIDGVQPFVAAMETAFLSHRIAGGDQINFCMDGFCGVQTFHIPLDAANALQSQTAKI